ncbi:hypothetical protein HYX19_02725 [Candidatus Woesearchaeota archaeon]|nr:hypothetical protein [Candidatus Woesearchaeota archaeon]
MNEQKIVLRIIIEILGNPQEHVNDTLKKIIEKIKSEFKVNKEEIYEAENVGKLWSAFTEVEMELNNVDQLIGICFEYMPSSIEILDPIEFAVKSNDLNNLLNDLMAKLHQNDMIIKNLAAENTVIKRELGKKQQN